METETPPGEWSPAPSLWVLTGKVPRCNDSLSLKQVLDFAHLQFGHADRLLAIREYGRQHGPLGVRRVEARPYRRRGPTAFTLGAQRVEGEPISAWHEEVRDADEAIQNLRMLGAFSVRNEPAPTEWEWLIAEGRLDGPRDTVALVARTRELINAKLAEYRVVLALGPGTSLPLPYTLANPTPIAAMWKRIAECAAQVNRIAFCEICRKPLVYDGLLPKPGRRKDVRTCSVRCRVEKYRREHPEKRRRAKKGEPQ